MLTRIVADKELENLALREVAKGRRTPLGRTSYALPSHEPRSTPMIDPVVAFNHGVAHRLSLSLATLVVGQTLTDRPGGPGRHAQGRRPGGPPVWPPASPRPPRPATGPGRERLLPVLDDPR